MLPVAHRRRLSSLAIDWTFLPDGSGGYEGPIGHWQVYNSTSLGRLNSAAGFSSRKFRWEIKMSLLIDVRSGILQFMDARNNDYWYARSPAFLGGSLIRFVEWIRIVPDLVFMLAGVIPVVVAALLTYLTIRRKPATA